MKREEAYSKEYKGVSSPTSTGRYLPSKKDFITKYLSENAICLKVDDWQYKGNFLWMENGVIVHINSTYENRRIGEKNVRRDIALEIMPADSEIPKGLAKILEQEKFIQKKLEE